MAIFFRFFVIAFAFGVACIAAFVVVAYGVFAPEFARLADAGPEGWLILLFLAGAAGFVLWFYVFAPAALLIAISEIFAIRSVLFHTLMGGLVGALAYVLTDIGTRFQGTGTVVPLTRELQLVVAGGLVGGFVYWLIAGRNAGIVFSPRKGS